ncbi:MULTISPECIES: thiol-disulfide oxidoreductase DCC family protein [Streptomyces]|uniref:thiol-disulfide oxidoreductase DCC family protein n=1 Tax=Streptomyces TaxID=1883 RepID=UPI0035A04A07
MAGSSATRDRGAARVPVLGLTVLYDARCSLCTFLRDWLGKQAQLVPLRFVPAGSDEARRRFPELDHEATLGEITVVGDGGQVYTGAVAWVVTLWALREYRPLAHRLSTPAGARLAKGATLAAAKWREGHTPGQREANTRGRGEAGARQQWKAQRRWGGGAYYSGDGWSYDPSTGWTYTAPGCDSGACTTR